MSQPTMAARPLRATLPERAPQPAPHLRVVEGTRGHARRTLLPIVAIVAVLFFFAIVVPLLANTDMARMSYAIRDQQVALNGKNAQIETLESTLLDAESAQNLEKKASKIGMVPAGGIGVISLKDHSVKGGVPAK